MRGEGSRILGSVAIVIGVILLLNASFNITGFVIFEDVGRGVSSILGIVFVIVGLVLMTSGRRERVLRRLEDSIEHRGITSYDELRRDAEQLGFKLREGPKGTEVYDGEKKVTRIPRRGKGGPEKYRIARDLYKAAA